MRGNFSIARKQGASWRVSFLNWHIVQYQEPPHEENRRRHNRIRRASPHHSVPCRSSGLDEDVMNEIKTWSIDWLSWFDLRSARQFHVLIVNTSGQK
jgi:hypothetical protein